MNNRPLKNWLENVIIIKENGEAVGEQKMREKYLLTLFRQGVYFNNSKPKDKEFDRNEKSCFFSSDYLEKNVKIYKK